LGLSFKVFFCVTEVEYPVTNKKNSLVQFFCEKTKQETAITGEWQFLSQCTAALD